MGNVALGSIVCQWREWVLVILDASSIPFLNLCLRTFLSSSFFFFCWLQLLLSSRLHFAISLLLQLHRNWRGRCWINSVQVPDIFVDDDALFRRRSTNKQRDETTVWLFLLNYEEWCERTHSLWWSLRERTWCVFWWRAELGSDELRIVWKDPFAVDSRQGLAYPSRKRWVVVQSYIDRYFSRGPAVPSRWKEVWVRRAHRVSRLVTRCRSWRSRGCCSRSQVRDSMVSLPLTSLSRTYVPTRELFQSRPSYKSRLQSERCCLLSNRGGGSFYIFIPSSVRQVVCGNTYLSCTCFIARQIWVNQSRICSSGNNLPRALLIFSPRSPPWKRVWG